MGKFEDAIAGLTDLEDLTSRDFDDVNPEDVLQATDADGDTLTVAYFVRSYADGTAPVAGVYIRTTKPGVVVSIEAIEAINEFLQGRVAQAKEAGLA